MRIESASGILLFTVALIALVWANSPWSEHYYSLLDIEVGLALDRFSIEMTVHQLVNDGLMTIFFFVVGLEIKRELAIGDLRDVKSAALPVAAALGGMLVPAAIYLAVHNELPARSGWAIPIATDIAFAVGIIALMGSRISHRVRVFILAAAIVDDIGAIIVIGAFYTSSLSMVPLGVAAAGLVLVILMQRAGVGNPVLYFAVGAVIWYGFLKSGIHPTIAGVVGAFLTPMSSPVPVWESLRKALFYLPARGMRSLPARHRNRETRKAMAVAEGDGYEQTSPLVRLESALHPWTAFVIMPVFALANTGVTISSSFLNDRDSLAVGAAIAVALVIGKPIGILTFSFLAIQARLARFPANVPWTSFSAAAVLTGIGFTVSLFIADLAFSELRLIDAAKIGVLTGSTIAAVLGVTMIMLSSKPAGVTGGQSTEL